MGGRFQSALLQGLWSLWGGGSRRRRIRVNRYGNKQGRRWTSGSTPSTTGSHLGLLVGTDRYAGQGAWVISTIPTICSKQNRSRIRREPACRTCIRPSNGVVTVAHVRLKRTSRSTSHSCSSPLSLSFVFFVLPVCCCLLLPVRAQCVSHAPTGGM